MLDFATLGLRVDNSKVKESKTALDQLGAAGEAAGAKVKQAMAPGAGAAALRRELAGTIAAMKDLKANYLNASVGEREFLDGMKQLQQQADATRSALAKIPEPVKQVEEQSRRASVSINALRSPLATLATQSIGTSGSLGQLSSVLLTLGAGSTIAIAFFAFLAAAGAAMRKQAQDAEALGKSVRDLGTAIDETNGLAAESRFQQATLDFLAAADDLKHAQSTLLRSDAAAQAVYNEKLAELLRASAALTEKRQQDAEDAKRGGEHTRQYAAEVFNLDVALRNLNRTFDAWLTRQKQPQLFTISSVMGRTPSQATVPNVDLSEANRLAEELYRSTVKLLPPVRTAAESWAAGADALEQSLRTGISLGETFGGLSAESASTLSNLVNIGKTLADAEAAALKAGKAFSLGTGDVLSLIAGGAGILSSIIGGGPSAADLARMKVEQENTRAVEKNTAAKLLGTDLTGSQFGDARAATDALLGAINQGQRFRREGAEQILAAGGLEDLQTLREQAKQLGIQIDTSSTQAFIDSLEALDHMLRQNELTRFTNTFAGALQAVNAAAIVFGRTDPLSKLQDTVALLSQLGAKGFKGVDSLGRPVNIPDVPGLGSPAFEAAFRGLDLTLAKDRAAALANLQNLFLQLKNGTLGVDQLGGLTAQELLDQLTGTIDLLNQVEESAKQRDADLLATVNALKGFSDSLKLSNLSPLSPVQQLEEARRQYQAALAKAQAGDQAAAAALPDVARQFLEASRAVNASGPQFAADFAQVVAQTDALAAMFDGMRDIQQQQLDAAKVTATNSGKTVAELQTMVQVLAVGLQGAIDKLDEVRTEAAADARKTRQAIEELA